MENKNSSILNEYRQAYRFIKPDPSGPSKMLHKEEEVGKNTVV